MLTKTKSGPETGTSSSDYNGIEPKWKDDREDRGNRVSNEPIEIDAPAQAARRNGNNDSLMVDDGVALVLAKVLWRRTENQYDRNPSRSDQSLPDSPVFLGVKRARARY
jgi:hypothetical protein